MSRSIPVVAIFNSSDDIAETLRDFLAELRKSDSVSGYHCIPAREPNLVDLPADLDPSVRSALAGRGIQKL